MTNFDNVFIGTGPISVIDACIKKKEGAKVLLIDKKDQVGGAWVSIPVGTFGRLEIGCHIWSYNKPAYQFLQNFLDLDLIELSPQPYFLKGNTRLVYDHKHGVTSIKCVLRQLKGFDFKGIKNHLLNNPALRFPIIPKKYLYPRGGARDLQNAIEQKIESFDIDTALNTTIKELVYKNGVWELISNTGERWQSKKVVLTATSAVKTIQFEGEKLNLEHRYLNYTHFHIVIKGKMQKPCSYVRVLDHHIIHRISDITYQLEEKTEEDITVILVGVFDNQLPKNETDDRMVMLLMKYLSDKKFVSENAELKYAQKNKFKTTYIDPEQVKIINQKAGLEVLATTDLIYGVYHRLKDWI